MKLKSLIHVIFTKHLDMKTLYFAFFTFFISSSLYSQKTIHKSVGLQGVYMNTIVNVANYKARINLFEGTEASLGLQASPGLGLETTTEGVNTQPAYSVPVAIEYIHGLTSSENNLSMKGWGTRLMLLTTNGGVNPEEILDLTPSVNAGIGISYIFQNENLQTAAIDINGFLPFESDENIIYDWGVSVGVRYLLGIY